MGNNVLINLKKSIAAGIVIGMSGFVYLSVENKYIGAFLFSLGLLTIISNEYNLFTGKVYKLQLNDSDSVFTMLEYLVGNFIGAYIIAGFVGKFAMQMNTDALWQNKLQNGWLKGFFLSVVCGMLMYIAVVTFAKNKHPAYVIMAIMAFILSGCEHCIANMFYLSLVNDYANYFQEIVYLFINIFGNAVGSLFLYNIAKPDK